MAISYKNWSGSVAFNPETIQTPSSEAEILQLIHDASAKGGKIRLIGSGHSFTPLIRTGHTLVSLDKFQGLESVDKENNRATVKTLRKRGFQEFLKRLYRCDKQGFHSNKVRSRDMKIAG